MAAKHLESQSHSRSLQNTNLEEFLLKFEQWQQTSLGVMKENENLQEEIKSYQKEKQRLNEMNIKFEKDISRLHGMINQLQKHIGSMVKFEDEVVALKNELDKKELESQALRTEIEMSRKDYDERIDRLKMENVEYIKETIKKHKKEEEEKVTELEKGLNEKNNDIKELEKSLLQLEDQKQREIVCLKIDFESKLKMFQRQKNQQSFSKSSTDQDIFRRKLHHLKEDYESKILKLKQTISSLEKKLAMSPVYGQTSREKIPLPLNKKKRY